ncbi:potassium/proton antiporter [Consotaella salsifontis]|uniref:Potassium/proton antiporter, CPA1 family n=1 Tax=Consotaella salsifontis TaxID=1365950 RepID=A0A1T4T3Q2_9HYPH|nr:potassium/proton antiporter [Consotaella salsifontis]SKA35135.1 potassium/proton antiporter, CPA1 family [Consotaella salsifontis]
MLDTLYVVILIGTGLILLAAFSSLLAFRFGAPILLVFLSIGLVAGVDGFGLDFDNPPLAYFIGSLALAIILFDSGFGTSLQSFRHAAAPALTLATVGVLLTTALFAAAAVLLLDLSWLQGALLGSIVGSTDAAAVFFLLRIGGINIRERVRATLEIESGSNDPMAIFLAIALVELLRSGSGFEAMDWNFLIQFAKQLGIGGVLGLVGGWMILQLVNRLSLERGLTPIFTIALSLLVFSVTGALGGSGFLAVYVAGLLTGNSHIRSATSIRRFQEGMSWLAQIVMFLVLGLLATPSQFAAIALPAVGLAFFLIFIARPLAIWFCLLPFRFSRNETAFISWVGLRGAVSILLAILPIIGGIDSERVFFNTAFIIVLVSLLMQGWTIGFMARRLGLIVPPRIGPVEKLELELPGTAHHELLSYRVVAGSPVARGQRLPRWARPSLVVRDGKSMRLQYAGRLQENDYVYLFISSRYPRLLDRLFASPVPFEPDDAEFFGEFTVEPGRPARLLAESYGIDLGNVTPETTVAELMVERLGGHAEYGDRVAVGSVELIVRDTDDAGEIAEVGLSLTPDTKPTLPLFHNFRDIVSVLRQTPKRRRKVEASKAKEPPSLLLTPPVAESHRDGDGDGKPM